MGIVKALGLDKVRFFFDIVKQNGGVKMSLYKMYRCGFLVFKLKFIVFVVDASRRF
jgi:hypothetical protein